MITSPCNTFRLHNPDLRLFFAIVLLWAGIVGASSAQSQDITPLPRLFIGGGALPEAMPEAFFKLAGPEARLVVIPTATGRKIDEEKIKANWQATGFKSITVLHTRDRKISLDPAFSKMLLSADAVWISGGSQSRLAEAYLNTPVERELEELLKRGGIIGGSSAGAAIMTRVMISGGNPEPEITTGFNLLTGVILDQHFLKRNRLPRLSAAIRANPKLVGLGIDEATAIVVENGELQVIGASYVIRMVMVDGQLQIDAYEAGEVIPLL